MKNIKRLSVLSLVLLLSSCNDGVKTYAEDLRAPSERNTISSQEIIDLFRGNYEINCQHELTTTYPDGYTAYNSTSVGSFTRDYGHVAETGEEAVRVYSADNTKTYFQDENGTAYSEALLPDNTVAAVEYGNYGISVLFSDVFRNPFNYIYADDITEDYHIDNGKAGFIISTYLGIDRAIRGAQFTFEDGLPTGIEFTIADKQFGFVTSTQGILSGNTSLEVEMSFTFDVDPFRHLVSSTNTNEDLETALGSFGTNYTATITSNGLTNDSRIYVTDAAIYFQSNAYSRHPSNDDILYVYNNGIYTVYNMVDGFPVRQTISAISAVDEYLSGILNISSSLFSKVNENTYLLIDDAKMYGGAALAPQGYGIEEDVGVNGYLEISSSHVDKAVSIISESGENVTLVTEFDDYGTTVLPSWIDLESL